MSAQTCTCDIVYTHIIEGVVLLTMCWERDDTLDCCQVWLFHETQLSPSVHHSFFFLLYCMARLVKLLLIEDLSAVREWDKCCRLWKLNLSACYEILYYRIETLMNSTIIETLMNAHIHTHTHTWSCYLKLWAYTSLPQLNISIIMTRYSDHTIADIQDDLKHMTSLERRRSIVMWREGGREDGWWKEVCTEQGEKKISE